MQKRTVLIAGLALTALAAAGYTNRERWFPAGAAEQPAARAPQRARSVPVETALAVRKSVPVNVEALGTVTPMASVAIKSRVETEIVGVHFVDGAEVQQGDLLFTLDSRAIEAQIAQTEGMVVRGRAQLEGAERDLRRASELLARNVGSQVTVDNAKTQTDMLRGGNQADEAALKNLRVQQSYTRIIAPIAGRISAANVKVGNFVRPADLAPLATIVQMKPVYVAFAVPQRFLPNVRQAMASKGARVEALVPGEQEPSIGKLAMIDNLVDATTGMVSVRALMSNSDEVLWPGTLINVVLTLRDEDAVAVPAAAVQSGQNGAYVFVVNDGTASVRPVTVARTQGPDAIISGGLDGGETIVLDGQMSLAEGTKVTARSAKAGS